MVTDAVGCLVVGLVLISSRSDWNAFRRERCSETGLVDGVLCLGEVSVVGVASAAAVICIVVRDSSGS